MANLVQSLLNESAQTAYSDQFSVANKLTKKWAKSGLLEGLNDHDRSSMAVILENQAKQLVIETSQTNANLNTGGSTFTATNGEQWAGVALPLVRKIFGQIAAKEFVSVQPMNLPAGLVFFLDFQYGTTGNPVFPINGSVYGANTVTTASGFGNAASGGLYGGGKFGYSVNEFSASIPSASFGFVAAIPTASFVDVNFDGAISASISAGQIYKLAIPVTALPTGYNNLGVRSFTLSGSTTATYTPANVLQNYTAFNSTGTTLFFYVTGSTGTAANAANITGSATLFYNKATDFNTRGDFEDRSGAPSVPNAYSPTSISIPEINVGMKSETISAKTRKLKAQWTPEFAQDLNAYHALDAEAELTGILSEHVSLEIDLEVMDMLIQSAPITEYWSAKVGNTIDQTPT